MSAPRRLRVADLFCGAGGLSEGLRQVGYEVVFGLDKDRDSCESFKLNHPDADVHCGPITGLTPKEIADRAGQVDLVVGGPSCQGFSTAGRRNGWVDPKDERNDLWSHMLAVVAALKPGAFLMENVPGLFAWKEGAFGWRIIEAFRSLGYGVSHDILLAADYGAPQLRRRLFIVGLLGAEGFDFPQVTHLGGWRRDTLDGWERKRVERGLLRHVSCWEAISDLPALDGGTGGPDLAYRTPALTPLAQKLRAGTGATVADHEAMGIASETKALVEMVPQGGTWRDIPAHLLPGRFTGMRRTDSTNLFGRLDPARPSYTINTQFTNVTTGCYTHPYEDRALSIREGARLQTFPDTYRFTGTATSRARQIGNAVPVVMGAVLGAAIAVHIATSDSYSIEPAPVVQPASAPPPAPPATATSTRMRRQKKVGTKPEMVLRKALHAAGLRYRVDASVIPGLRRRADLLFSSAKVAVFVDGCFWHGCETHARSTKSNTLWWAEKIATNKRRDAETTAVLETAGWRVERVWEHEDPAEAALRIETIVREAHALAQSNAG